MRIRIWVLLGLTFISANVCTAQNRAATRLSPAFVEQASAVKAVIDHTFTCDDVPCAVYEPQLVQLGAAAHNSAEEGMAITMRLYAVTLVLLTQAIEIERLTYTISYAHDSRSMSAAGVALRCKHALQQGLQTATWNDKLADGCAVETGWVAAPTAKKVKR